MTSADKSFKRVRNLRRKVSSKMGDSDSHLAGRKDISATAIELLA